MLVIEGKVGKSKVLEDWLNKNVIKGDTFGTCIIDYVEIPQVLSGLANHYCQKGHDMTVETAVEDYFKWWKSFKNFKTIVFSVNAPLGMLEDFKRIEKRFNNKLVVTFQNNTMDNVEVWEY